MDINVVMPAIGAGTTQGKILQWLKQTGETIRAGDILAEIETDKAVIELEALDGGVLHRIHVEAGDAEVPVGDVIAVLRAASAAAAPAEAGADLARAAPAPAVEAAPAALPQAAMPAAVNEPASLRVFASPSARRLARELGVDLCSLSGSGPAGRIVRVDIERAAPPAPAPATSAPAASRASSLPAQASAPPASGGLTPHTPMRRTIARRLVQSKQDIPHFYLSVQCRMDGLLAARTRLNAAQDRRYSLNDLLVLAAARALQQVPDVNVQWTEGGTLRHGQVDIGVAVALDDGLITPVLRDVGQAGLRALAGQLSDLVDLARRGRLRPEQYEGGSLTISNLGMYGVHEFAAIINPPQSAILAAGAVLRQPVVDGDEIRIGNVMSLTLSADHRVVDGAAGARYLAAVQNLLENPIELIL
ncbi:dihydrolipoamide acetyltransferase family protein [Bordetella genomosp. 12]|uniref:Dihydrolipoamide acetyltransferase component of pyruvate dehydrogenase complex n=1 Tax=Bordetella genomosp. 12 TaxID=463035 RepID=A0A261VAL8_9BORD|nr:dihydrolipoamide acetyltransferase family protein [Bordetella genomosp. 12]OZI70811.1 branched-chain alpha-keto acid dehydrogenase subunit E2 [Bordetella genomosp. 12]